MTDIKELALKVAKEFTADVSTHDSLVDFAQRFLAAYLAEPVAWHCKGKDKFGGFYSYVVGDKKPTSDDYLEVIPLYAAPPEPAPQQETIMPGRYKGDALCAAPSSEEVQEMANRLRNDETDLFRLQEKAADLIERLASRVPDGCVVVPREAIDQINTWADAYPTDIFPEVSPKQWKTARWALDGCHVTLDRISASNMRHVLTKVRDLIAAGEVKP